MRYVQLYKYDCYPPMKEKDIAEVNSIFDTDENLNPMINSVFHECVWNRFWQEVPLELDAKITGWNWKLKDCEYGYVEIISNEALTQEELDIMGEETDGQISDGYNENPFKIKVGKTTYSIQFHEFPVKAFAEG